MLQNGVVSLTLVSAGGSCELTLHVPIGRVAKHHLQCERPQGGSYTYYT